MRQRFLTSVTVVLSVVYDLVKINLCNYIDSFPPQIQLFTTPSLSFTAYFQQRMTTQHTFDSKQTTSTHILMPPLLYFHPNHLTVF